MAKDKKKKRKRKKAGTVVGGAEAIGATGGEPVLLTIPEVCRYLGISRATVYRLDLPGRLKIGNQVRYHKASIDRWILDQLG